jgi:hypothetical protein
MRSQTSAIIDYLATGKSLTPLLALDRFSCFRLAARISDLRRAGHRISCELVKMGNGKRVGRYRLVR